jgi:hypothetical protein
MKLRSYGRAWPAITTLDPVSLPALRRRKARAERELVQIREAMADAAALRARRP